MEFYPEGQYANNPEQLAGPTLHCLGHMVQAAGFDRVEGWKLLRQLPIAFHNAGVLQGGTRKGKDLEVRHGVR